MAAAAAARWGCGAAGDEVTITAFLAAEPIVGLIRASAMRGGCLIAVGNRGAVTVAFFAELRALTAWVEAVDRGMVVRADVEGAVVGLFKGGFDDDIASTCARNLLISASLSATICINLVQRS